MDGWGAEKVSLLMVMAYGSLGLDEEDGPAELFQ